WSCKFSPDGKKILSASWSFIGVWNSDTGNQLLTLTGHNNYVNTCSFSPDGKKILSGSSDKSLRIWNVETGDQLFKIEGNESVLCCAYSPNGQKIVYRSNYNTISIWSTQQFEENEIETLKQKYDLSEIEITSVISKFDNKESSLD